MVDQPLPLHVRYLCIRLPSVKCQQIFKFLKKTTFLFFSSTPRRLLLLLGLRFPLVLVFRLVRRSNPRACHIREILPVTCKCIKSTERIIPKMPISIRSVHWAIFHVGI